MVRQLMMRIRDAELRVRPRALLASVHERDDARQVALIRQHLQVVEQLHVLVERVGNADRPIDIRQLAPALLLGLLDAPLDVAQRLEVVADFRVVRRRRASAEAASRGRSPSRECFDPGAAAAMRTRGSVLSLAPNRRSNTTRGSFSDISGSVGVSHDSVLLYAQLYPVSHDPTRLFVSTVSCSDESCVSRSKAFAAIWSIETPFSDHAVRLLHVHARQIRTGRA